MKIGLVASLNRPGGNATGINDFGVGIGTKRLGLLHELLPGATRFGVLVNPDNPIITDSFVTELQTAASAIGRQIEVVTASTNADIDRAFVTLVKQRADALVISRTRCSSPVVCNSSRWRCAIRSRRCTIGASLPKLAG